MRAQHLGKLVQLFGVDATVTLVANYFSRIFSSFGVITVPATPWNPGHSAASTPDRRPVNSLHRSMSLKTSRIEFATSVAPSGDPFHNSLGFSFPPPEGNT